MQNSKLKNIGSGVLVSLSSIMVIAILLEIGVRLFAPVTDYPIVNYDPEVGLHLAPNQTGKRTFGPDGTVGGRYRANNAGWNSLHEYTAEKPEGSLRVAVIGDSFIEGLQVNVDQLATEVLEDRLAGAPECSRYSGIAVDNYGMSGAPMSQYVSMIRYVARNYPADVYIVNVVSNDFYQSWAKANARESFMHYTLADDGSIREVPPIEAGEGSPLRLTLVQSALFRYVYFNLQATQTFNELQNRARSGGGEEEEVNAEGDAENILPKRYSDPNHPEVQALPELVRLMLGEMKSTSDAGNARLLLTMDADRQAIVTGTPVSAVHNSLFGTLREVAPAEGVELLDLTGPFTLAWEQNHEPLYFAADYHWTAPAHTTAAEAMTEWIKENVCAAGK